MSRFDEVIDRKNTNSLKHDFAAQRGKPEGILPLWVADMDFRAADEILEELQKAVAHGIFGYSVPQKDYTDALYQWFLKRFSWEIEPEWLIKTPGVVFAINAAMRAFTEENDSVIIQQPVYYPFSSVITENGRKLINNELVYQNGHYEMNFTDFEQKIVDNKVKLFILCSPHNPVGRVWKVQELERIAKICLKHNVFIISDEIHCDFTYQGYEHTILASLSKEIADNCMICTAPSKTFNLAGLQTSNIFIKKEEQRERFKREIFHTGYDEINRLGLVACKAAYEKGESWLDELREYLKGNLDMVRIFLKEKLPQITLIEPEGTYLLWLDCSGLGLTDNELEQLIVQKAKLWLDSGNMFGKQSGQFERVNIASPRSVLQKALEQLESAIASNSFL